LFRNSDGIGKVIEVFGLPKSGKTTLLKELKKKGVAVSLSNYQRNPHDPMDTSLVRDFSLVKKLFYFLSYLVFHPIKSFHLFLKLNSNWIILRRLGIGDYIKIFLIRNSYLAAVLARYNLLEKEKSRIFVDEFILQSLFMILQKSSSEREIKKVLRNLPNFNQILLIEIDPRERARRSEKSLRESPTRKLNREYFRVWRKNQEANYSIIKRLLLKRYETIESISDTKMLVSPPD